MISAWWLLLIVPVCMSAGFACGAIYVVSDIFEETGP